MGGRSEEVESRIPKMGKAGWVENKGAARTAAACPWFPALATFGVSSRAAGAAGVVEEHQPPSQQYRRSGCMQMVSRLQVDSAAGPAELTRSRGQARASAGPCLYRHPCPHCSGCSQECLDATGAVEDCSVIRIEATGSCCESEMIL
jgi:hypothetical protein